MKPILKRKVVKKKVVKKKAVKKSPAKKALVGKQKNLPDAIKKSILAAKPTKKTKKKTTEPIRKNKMY
jgi:hypothetical protein